MEALSGLDVPALDRGETIVLEKMVSQPRWLIGMTIGRLFLTPKRIIFRPARRGPFFDIKADPIVIPIDNVAKVGIRPWRGFFSWYPWMSFLFVTDKYDDSQEFQMANAWRWVEGIESARTELRS